MIERTEGRKDGHLFGDKEVWLSNYLVLIVLQEGFHTRHQSKSFGEDKRENRRAKEKEGEGIARKEKATGVKQMKK